MMSTALLIAVGGEQTKVHPATSDRVEGAETSFAQSFGERVGLSADVRTKSGAGDVLREIQEEKSSGQLKSPTAPAVASIGVKANVTAKQEVVEPENSVTSVTKDAHDSLLVEIRPVAHADVPEQKESTPTLSQLPANSGELLQKGDTKTVAKGVLIQTKTLPGVAPGTGNKEQSLGDVEHSQIFAAVTNDAIATKSTAVEPVSHESVAAAPDRSLSRNEIEIQPLVQNETVAMRKISDVAPVKKEVKTQRSDVEAKAVQKTSGITESVKIPERESIVPTEQGAAPLPTQMSTPNERPQNAVAVTVADASDVLGTMTAKLAAVTLVPAAENTARKAIVQGGKNEVETTGQLVSPPADKAIATGPAAGIAKAVPAASPASKDVDAKEQNVVGAVTMVHSVAEASASSGIVPGIMPGHMPTEINETKAQAGAHAVTTPQAGSGEQDGSGALSGETGMSHRTLLATPTALEVGLANGTQGWLKIRAEMTDGGVVNASLSSATSAGQEMLHRELPALTAYLHEERVAVNTVVVPANAAGGSESRFAGGMSGEGSGQAQEHGSRKSGGDDQPELIHGASDRAEEIPTYVGSTGVGDEGLYSAGAYAGGGSWLNVRA